MVIQKAVNNLKEKGSKDDKVAVASGIAISVVLILLVAWAFFFLRGIARGTHSIDLSGGAQDEFNFTTVTEAQKALEQQFSNSGAAAGQSDTPTESQPVQMQVSGQGEDQFGTPSSEN